MPERVQRKRTKGWVKPPNTICVTRGTPWGNPFKVGADGTAKEVIGLFRVYAEFRLSREPGWLEPLRGKDLACFCRLSDPCHADVLLSLANKESR